MSRSIYFSEESIRGINSQLDGKLPKVHENHIRGIFSRVHHGMNTLIFLMFNRVDTDTIQDYVCQVLGKKFLTQKYDYNALVERRHDYGFYDVRQDLVRTPSNVEISFVIGQYLPFSCAPGPSDGAGAEPCSPNSYSLNFLMYGDDGTPIPPNTPICLGTPLTVYIQYSPKADGVYVTIPETDIQVTYDPWTYTSVLLGGVQSAKVFFMNEDEADVIVRAYFEDGCGKKDAKEFKICYVYDPKFETENMLTGDNPLTLPDIWTESVDGQQPDYTLLQASPWAKVCGKDYYLPTPENPAEWFISKCTNNYPIFQNTFDQRESFLTAQSLNWIKTYAFRPGPQGTKYATDNQYEVAFQFTDLCEAVGDYLIERVVRHCNEEIVCKRSIHNKTFIPRALAMQYNGVLWNFDRTVTSQISKFIDQAISLNGVPKPAPAVGTYLRHMRGVYFVFPSPLKFTFHVLKTFADPFMGVQCNNPTTIDAQDYFVDETPDATGVDPRHYSPRDNYTFEVKLVTPGGSTVLNPIGTNNYVEVNLDWYQTPMASELIIPETFLEIIMTSPCGNMVASVYKLQNGMERILAEIVTDDTGCKQVQINGIETEYGDGNFSSTEFTHHDEFVVTNTDTGLDHTGCVGNHPVEICAVQQYSVHEHIRPPECVTIESLNPFDYWVPVPIIFDQVDCFSVIYTGTYPALIINYNTQFNNINVNGDIRTTLDFRSLSVGVHYVPTVFWNGSTVSVRVEIVSATPISFQSPVPSTPSFFNNLKWCPAAFLEANPSSGGQNDIRLYGNSLTTSPTVTDALQNLEDFVVGPNIITQGDYSNSIAPIIDSDDGCMYFDIPYYVDPLYTTETLSPPTIEVFVTHPGFNNPVASYTISSGPGWVDSVVYLTSATEGHVATQIISLLPSMSIGWNFIPVKFHSDCFDNPEVFVCCSGVRTSLPFGTKYDVVNYQKYPEMFTWMETRSDKNPCCGRFDIVMETYDLTSPYANGKLKGVITIPRNDSLVFDYVRRVLNMPTWGNLLSFQQGLGISAFNTPEEVSAETRYNFYDHYVFTGDCNISSQVPYRVDGPRSWFHVRLSETFLSQGEKLALGNISYGLGVLNIDPSPPDVFELPRTDQPRYILRYPQYDKEYLCEQQVNYGYYGSSPQAVNVPYLDFRINDEDRVELDFREDGVGTHFYSIQLSPGVYNVLEVRILERRQFKNGLFAVPETIAPSFYNELRPQDNWAVRGPPMTPFNWPDGTTILNGNVSSSGYLTHLSLYGRTLDPYIGMPLTYKKQIMTEKLYPPVLAPRVITQGDISTNTPPVIDSIDGAMYCMFDYYIDPTWTSEPLKPPRIFLYKTIPNGTNNSYLFHVSTYPNGIEQVHEYDIQSAFGNGDGQDERLGYQFGGIYIPFTDVPVIGWNRMYLKLHADCFNTTNCFMGLARVMTSLPYGYEFTVIKTHEESNLIRLQEFPSASCTSDQETDKFNQYLEPPYIDGMLGGYYNTRGVDNTIAVTQSRVARSSDFDDVIPHQKGLPFFVFSTSFVNNVVSGLTNEIHTRQRYPLNTTDVGLQVGSVQLTDHTQPFTAAELFSDEIVRFPYRFYGIGCLVPIS